VGTRDLVVGLLGRLLEDRHEDPIAERVTDPRTLAMDDDEEVDVRVLAFLASSHGSIEADGDEVAPLPLMKLGSNRGCEVDVPGHRHRSVHRGSRT